MQYILAYPNLTYTNLAYPNLAYPNTLLYGRFCSFRWSVALINVFKMGEAYFVIQWIILAMFRYL